MALIVNLKDKKKVTLRREGTREYKVTFRKKRGQRGTKWQAVVVDLRQPDSVIYPKT